MPSHAARANQVSTCSDILSSSNASATSNHTIVFTVRDSIVSQGGLTASSNFSIAFPSNFNLATLTCNDVDLLVAGSATSLNVANGDGRTNCPNTATAWGVNIDSANRILLLTSPTSVNQWTWVATGIPVTVQVGSNATNQGTGSNWITNPSSAGVYTISVGGTFNGSGNILVSVNQSVSVQATVAESLAFTASSVNAVNCTADDGATVNTVTSTATSVPFGTISPNTFYQGCQDLVVSTNAGNGYSVTVQESHAMMTANGQFTIPDTTCDNADCSVATATTWVTPTKNGFGHTCFNQAGSDCVADYANGTKFKPLNSPTGVTPGTIAFVQSARNSASGAGSINQAFSSNNTASNLIIVSTNWADAGSTLTARISDSQGNTYATAVGPIINSAISNPLYSQIWYAKNVKGGANTVTVTYSSTPSVGEDIRIHEYSGLDISNPFDVGASATGTNAGNAASATSSIRAPNELIFGNIGASGGGTSSAGPGFTKREGAVSDNDITEDKIVTAGVSYQAAFTQSGNNAWIASMATFRASSSPVALMLNTGPVTNSTGRVKYRLSAGSAQPAGTYTTIVTYTILGTF